MSASDWPLTIFVHLFATSSWLVLSRERRRQIARTDFQSVTQRFPSITVRHYDAEAFTAHCSDILAIETPCLADYHCFMEALRDTTLLATPYFEIRGIYPAIQDGYLAYEALEDKHE